MIHTSAYTTTTDFTYQNVTELANAYNVTQYKNVQ